MSCRTLGSTSARGRCAVLLAPAVALAVCAGLVTPPAQAAPVPSGTAARAAAPATAHSFQQLTSDAQLRAGTVGQGVRVRGGALRMGPGKEVPATTTSYAGSRWRTATWLSPWTQPTHDFTELVPSWEARTPSGTYVTVQARVVSAAGTSGWKVMARWSGLEDSVRRSTAGSQADRVASVATDTLRAAAGTSLTRYQLRVDLHRLATTRRTPTVRSVAAVASRLGAVPRTSTPLYGALSLDVPRYSQMVHRGRYPQYGGGGQAWCSPTSLTMVLAYHRALPPASEYAWVSRRYSDRVVPGVARAVYDHGYRGAGNWAFNTAYAANRAGSAFVTRLTDLRDAERFVAAGIPLVTSVSFGRGQLRGAPIGSTAGHLLVVRGFTASGDVLVNDPAAPSNGSVARTYDRGEFERAWLGKSGGLTYVVSSPSHPLPQARRG